jgi:hypothetical protein
MTRFVGTRTTVVVAVSAVSLISFSPAATVGQSAVRAEKRAASCPKYSVRARVAGKMKCLRDGQACSARFERQYQRYGFHCQARALTATWRRLKRPLHFPSLTSGEPCPISALASQVDFRSYGVGQGVGTGPVYPAPFSPDATQQLNDYMVPPGWQGGKHAFLTVPSYRGPTLIRGAQLDGPHVVTFASNEIHGAPNLADPKPELRLPTGTRTVVHSFFFLIPPGCYAYQIDGTTFSEVVVFRVRLSS